MRSVIVSRDKALREAIQDNLKAMIDLDEITSKGEELDISSLEYCFHGSEIYLSYALLRWLVQYNKLSLTNLSKSDLDQILSYQPDLISYIHQVLEHLEISPSKSGATTIFDISNQFSLDLQIDFSDPESDEYGKWIQNGLTLDNRKTLASNYTMDTSNLFRTLPMKKSDGKDWLNYSVCDHFCGSGNLVIGALSTQQQYPDLIRINDLMPTPVLLAYCRIIAIGYIGSIEATIGDGFKVEGTYDMVLINPPYTRSHRIGEDLKKKISHLEEKIGNANTGHAGLHFWAVLGVEDLMSKEGTAVIILPRASINAQYSQALKEYLLATYKELDFIEYQNQKAFSYGSDLKELILILTKLGRKSLTFSSIKPHNELVRIQEITFDTAYHSRNWGMYFLKPDAVQLGLNLISSLNLRPRIPKHGQPQLDIKRGIELYGPNAFFFPNKKWSITIKGEISELINGDHIIQLDKSYFEPILRKPNLYKTQISPEINHYVITLPEERTKPINRFLKLIKSSAKAARNRFGSDWYRHPTMQIERKQPSGHLFIIDKLDVTSTPTLAYYTPEEQICTKNFYVVKVTDNDPAKTKFLGAWLNSTIYFLLYLLHRREIGGTYGRMQIIDYDYHPVFPDLDRIANVDQNDAKLQRVFETFDELRTKTVSHLGDQLFLKEKQAIDVALLNYFDADISVDKIHSTVNKLLADRNV